MSIHYSTVKVFRKIKLIQVENQMLIATASIYLRVKSINHLYLMLCIITQKCN